MIISLRIYSIRSDWEELIHLIREFIKIGIRCFVLTDELSGDMEGFDSRYFVVEKFPSDLLTGSEQSAFLRKEEEFFRKNRIRGVIRNIELLKESDKSLISGLESLIRKKEIPAVDLKSIAGTDLSGRESSLKTAGNILNFLISKPEKGHRYTVIDVGTNNILLVWAEIESGNDRKIRIIHRASQISALGKNIRNGMLTKAGISRAKKILANQIRISGLVTDKIITAGTSCSREAKNINELSEWLEEKQGIKYHILSEDEEAELSGLANRKLFNEFRELILFDIGGGSTEFICFSGDKMLYKKSLKLGIRRLEKQSKSDEKSIRYLIRKKLSVLPADLLSNPVLTGIGGTVTNISGVKQKLIFYDSETVHKSQLTRDDIDYYLKVFRRSTLSEIAGLMPFEPLRANVIITGLMIVSEILEYFGKESFYVSDYGLQFGILTRIAENRDSPFLLQ